MTNLEFINEQIEECNKVIEHLKIRIIEDTKYPTLKERHKEEIKNITQLKQRLQQIKTDLKAWEVVKKKITIQRGEIIDHILYVKKGNGALTHEEYKPLKKALELKNV